MPDKTKKRPGEVRDAILNVLETASAPLSASEIHRNVEARIGATSSSSIRSYLRLNAGEAFVKVERGKYAVSEPVAEYRHRSLFSELEPPENFKIGKARMILQDCFDWLESAKANSVHAVVTDPPYGLVEYSTEQKRKLRDGKGGVWRIPPSFDGCQRSPLPRFTTLSPTELREIHRFFQLWGERIRRVLVPGANVVVASNPLVSHLVSAALADAGLERRGEIIRLVMTMRGGDRPKAAHLEFSEVSVMPRSMWEPWIVFRKPLEGRVQDNLRKWKTGGFRRPSPDKPFGDVIKSAPTRGSERALAPHPSLKPQGFMRQIIRAVLPLGEGIVLDTFAGAGSTLAAANAVGYSSMGIETDPEYFEIARNGIAGLEALNVELTK